MSSSCTRTSISRGCDRVRPRGRASVGRLRTLSTGSGEWGDERPAVILLTGTPDPDLLADLDPSLVGRSEQRSSGAAYLEQVAARHVNWVIVSAPNEGWATQVFGEPDVERLEGHHRNATRCPGPGAGLACSRRTARGAGRRSSATSRAFAAVRFRGPGTDLDRRADPGIPLAVCDFHHGGRDRARPQHAD